MSLYRRLKLWYNRRPRRLKQVPRKLKEGWTIIEVVGRVAADDGRPTLSNKQKADPREAFVKEEKHENLVYPGLKYFLEGMEI